MHVSSGVTKGLHLVDLIVFWSSVIQQILIVISVYDNIFTHIHRLNSWHQGVGWYKLQCLFAFEFVEETLNNAISVQNIFQPILLLFLQQDNYVLFQQDNAYPYDTHATQQSLQDVWHNHQIFPHMIW